VSVAIAAQPQTTLTIRGDHFAIDGTGQFIAFVSYFDGLNRPMPTLGADLDWLSARGIGGIYPLVFATVGILHPRRRDTTLDVDLLGPIHVLYLRQAVAELGKLREIRCRVGRFATASETDRAGEVCDGFHVRRIRVALIRFRGHVPKGGYDVPNGQGCSGPASPATVL
jgi:hypothetical protein